MVNLRNRFLCYLEISFLPITIAIRALVYLIGPVVSTDLTKYSYPNLTNLIRQPTPDPCFHPPDNPASNNLFFFGSLNRQNRRVQLSTPVPI